MDPYTGEITLFAGPFAPRNWAYCNGATLPISSNSALFSILGTTYGGDGRSTFALPNLTGRVAIHSGNSQGPGLRPYSLGARGGVENAVLTPIQMPSHTHAVTSAKLKATNKPFNSNAPANVMPSSAAPINTYAPGTSTADIAMQDGSVKVTVEPTGNSNTHNNMPPVQGMSYIMCLYGVYPSRS